jgi:hypothetical protein
MKKWSEMTDKEVGYRVLAIAASVSGLMLLGQLGDPAAYRKPTVRSDGTVARELSSEDQKILRDMRTVINDIKKGRYAD